MPLSKIPGHVFKFVEGELYHLEENKKDLNDLKEDIAASQLGNMEYDDMPKGSGGFHSSTETATMDILSNKVAMRAERTIKCIEKALKRLDDEKLELFMMKYQQGKPWQQITMDLNISKRTFFRWRKEVVEKVARELGMID